MAISCEESDGKEESARDCCTTTCDKSCLQNASHSCTQALHAGAASASKEIEEAAAAAAASPEEAAAEEEDPPSPSLLSNETPAPAETHSPEDPPSPSHLPNVPFAKTHLHGEGDTRYGAAENICASRTNFPDEQTLHNLSPMAQSSSSSKPHFSPSPPSTTSLHIDQDTNNNRHSQQQQLQQHQASLLNDNASIPNSHDLFSSVANSLDPNAREFIPIAPSLSSSLAIRQQKAQAQALHSYTPSFQEELCSLNHQMGSLNLEVGAFNAMANYEPVHPNQEQNRGNQEMGAAFYNMDPSISDVDYYMGFQQKPDGPYENHGYGVYQAASHMGFPVNAPGGVLASPSPLHNMGLSPLAAAMASSPSPLIGAPIAAPPFMSVPPAGLMEAQLSSSLHSQRHHPPFYGYGSSKEHVSRALLISGLPPHHNEAQVREELERWGTIRAIQAEVFSQGLQITVQYFDLRAARQALRDMQNMYQQNQELHANSSYRHQVGVHKEGLAGSGRRGLLCGNVVSAQYIAAWTMQVPDAHNQGTLVLFNVGADVNMQDLRRVFEAYGNVREVREAPTKRQHKFVEFYDTRSAAAAWTALNGQEICGKCVKIEFSRQGGSAARRQKAEDKAHQEMIAASSNAGTQMQGTINMDPCSWNGDIVSQRGLQGFINGGVHHQGWEGWLFNEGFASHFPVNVCVANRPSTLQIPHPDVAARYGSGRFLGDGTGRIGAPEAQHGLPLAPRRAQQLHNFDPELRQVVAATQSHYAGGAGGVKDRHMGSSRHTKGDADFKFDEDEIYTRTSNPRTTLMIQNIPNKYSQKMLLSMLDQHCLQFNTNLGIDEPEAAYDFMYLPIDFKNKCNLGYAFVNFTTPQATLGFYKVFHGKAWEEFNSRKICGVAFARLQGRSALEEHFRTSRFACDTEEYLPVLFVPPRNGANLSQPRVAVGQLGIVRGCRTGNGGHNVHSHTITNQPSDSTSEHNKVLSHSNSETSSACEADENTLEGVAQDTKDALDMPPPEIGV